MTHVSLARTRSAVSLDTNILYSRTLRDWHWMLMVRSVLQSGLNRIEPRVSEDVLAELLYRIRRANPHLGDVEVGGIRERLLNNQPESVVVRGYSVVDVPVLDDSNDLHVIAAATHARVDYLVTEDSGFHSVADEFEFETLSADEMLCLIAERRPELVLRVTQEQFRYWNRRAKESGRGISPMDEALRAANAPCFAEEVRKAIKHLAVTGQY